MFDGFESTFVETSQARIKTVHGRAGPPVLLLHGFPETHVMWHKVAPILVAEHTVVCTDLRGHGDSSKPPDGESHRNYSKRAMARDQIEVMAELGFERFALVGHDRGSRVGHRLAPITRIGSVVWPTSTSSPSRVSLRRSLERSPRASITGSSSLSPTTSRSVSSVATPAVSFAGACAAGAAERTVSSRPRRSSNTSAASPIPK